MTAAAPLALERVRTHAPWLLREELGVCVVGSTALAEACRRNGVVPRVAGDLDLSWALSLEAAQHELELHDVYVATTDANRARGTLAMQLADERVEITCFRDSGPDRGLRDRIHEDLAQRDMTIGALAWQLANDEIHDPFDGLEHWRTGRIEPVGPVAERVAEHPVRWIRYFRLAHAFGFQLAPSIRKLKVHATTFAPIPPEATAAELRKALTDLASPGRFLLELHEAGGLVHIAPELAPQFDGRPAGPVRHHPEVSQALHLILALEWAARETREFASEDRLAVLVAVLCHDLGKSLTDLHRLPAHHGHEHSGLPLVTSLLERLPGLTDAKGRRLAEKVCALHLTARKLRGLKPGTLARLYEDVFRARDFPVRLFALAVAADCAGRLGRDDEGPAIRGEIERDIEWLRECCGTVDAAALREQFPDTERFRAELHQSRASAIRAAQ